MTDEQIIAAVRQCRAARELLDASIATEEKLTSTYEAEFKDAQVRSGRARENYRAAMSRVFETWKGSPASTTPELTGITTPPKDIFDVLESGVIPGAPDVEPVHQRPPQP